MKLFRFLLLTFFFFCYFLLSVDAQTNIVDCAFLQKNITLNDATVSYFLSQDLDCSTVNPFVPLGNSNTQPFKGVIDGKGFKIKNLNITDGNQYIGIFRTVDGGVIRNLTLQDITVITSSPSNVGALYGQALNITVEDVHMATSLQSQNLIQCTASTSFVGGLGGIANKGTINRVSVTNTTVDAPTSAQIGGVTNLGIPSLGQYVNPDISVSYVFNHGFPSNASQTIVSGGDVVGGVFGYLLGGSVTNSGTTRGSIVGTTNVGGFAGLMALCNLDSIFVRPTVLMIPNQNQRRVGGLFGTISSDNVANAPNMTVSNVYSRVPQVSGNSILGGLVGYLLQYTRSSQLTFSNAYVATNVTGTTDAGAIFGFSSWIPSFLTLDKVYYDNSLANDTFGLATGMSCSELFINVSANFPSNIWGNDRLKIEPDYSVGVCNCASGCPTPAPTPAPTTVAPNTSAPTTSAPTTASPTSSPIDFSGVYNVFGSCQSSQSCCCPTGKLSVVQQGTNVTVSISQVTGNCSTTGAQTATFVLTSSTSGSGTFNGQSYSFSYSNQKLSFSSTQGCSTQVQCESGNCRSLPSGASRMGASLMFFVLFFLGSLLFF